MPFRRSVTTRGFRRAQRRESRWLEIPAVSTSLAAASTAVISHVFTTEELALRPFTIVRTRGVWHGRSDQAGANENWHIGLSAAIISEQAIAVGVTAVPTPFTDQGSDLFFLYELMVSRVQVITAAGFESATGIMLPFDTKAMRKVEDGQDIALCQETSSLSAGVVVTLTGRMLIKLH